MTKTVEYTQLVGSLLSRDGKGTGTTIDDKLIVQVEGGGMDEEYVVRRITPIEAERLQGFPEEISLNTKIMNRDEAVAFALINKDILVDPETGKVFRTRGPGGVRYKLPVKIKSSNCNGYNVFCLHAGGMQWQIREHRAIWIAVHGIPQQGFVVDHINNNKKDNRISNLQLLTKKQNSTKAALDGFYKRGNNHPKTKIPVELRTVIYKDYISGGGNYRQLAKKYGISFSRVAQIVQKKGYTNIEYNGKPAPDSLRYKCLGNSFSVNVVQWIAKRILDVEKEGEDAG